MRHLICHVQNVFFREWEHKAFHAVKQLIIFIPVTFYLRNFKDYRSQFTLSTFYFYLSDILKYNYFYLSIISGYSTHLKLLH